MTTYKYIQSYQEISKNMETTSAALFISISLVVFGISYYYFTTRHKERMEIIARGLSPDHFKGQTNLLPYLLILGMTSIGIALGIAAGTVVSTLLQLEKLFTIAFGVFLGLGIALIFSYALLKRMQKGN
ncbi:hypothetical protein OQX61_12295 [Pedobacter sp. PLR]|uniref:DUF6249 domain-containing protein n=1 Tax=Pedobacter sp. PLR TaxID=2994465 RepID=UPI002247438B|nr:DUF6249 domain-containing protein [Pedobacter sp. PLR]MCX2452043.1 hypothetical protein [Pedobacter sp. PLR]